MIKNRDEFFGMLWEDYISFDEKERDKCFVYGYLKQKKDSRAEVIGRSRDAVIDYSGQKKRDKYILLKSAYLAMERYEVMNEEEYVGILKELIGNSVPKKYRELCGRKAVAQAEEAFERRFLIGCVSDFFYNLGYRTNRNIEHGQSVKLPSKHLKEDGYNDEFEMMYRFSVYSNDDMTADADKNVTFGSLDDEYIQKCSKLYDTLLKERNSMAFVPLYIDSETGAGVYIIGRDKFDEDTLCYEKTSRTDVCLVCIAYFYAVDAITKIKSSPTDDLSVTMMIRETFKSVKKAFDCFKASVSEKDFYENYPDENDERLPRNTDEQFQLYFISKKKAEDIRKKAIRQDMDKKERFAVQKLEEEERLRQRLIQSQKRALGNL